MRGIIKKIIIEDFITYEYVEIDPGVKMNMIVGPNGSGKSSILCAICLGLGGKPKSIGRVTKLGDYVKTGCNKATIRIELQGTNNQSIIVTRIIGHEGSSTWSLNGKTVQHNKIEEMTNDMSIFMDNLCQFLSQERVQDFSKMNAKELLYNTQKTVGSPEMTNNHTKLIELCKRSKANEATLLQYQSSLDREIQKCEVLKEKVDSLKERLHIIDKIKNLKLKRHWVLYNEHLADLEEVKKDYKLASDNLKEKKKIFAPLEKAIQTMKQRVTVLGNTIKAKMVPGQSLQAAIEAEDQIMQKMVQNQRNLLEQEKAEKSRRQNLYLNEQKLIQCDLEMKHISDSFNEVENQNQLKEATKELQKLDAALQQLAQTLRLKTRDLSEYNRELEDLQGEKAELMSLENRKWENLKKNDRDAFRASKWVSENRQRFAGMVLQSMMLEIKMTRNPNDGRYLEMLIPRQDKKALLCEKSEEMKVLVQQLKGELKARVNVLQAPNERPNIHQVSKSDLKKCGFEAYVSDLFDCPLPIFNYLCRSRGIHQVPVAATEKQVNMNLARNKFTRFFAGDCLFSIKTSKYSGLQSMRTVPLTQTNSFNFEVDDSAMERINEREKELGDLKQGVQQEVLALQEKQKHLEAEKEKINQKRVELKQVAAHLRTLGIDRSKIVARIATFKSQKADLEKATVNCHNENKKLVMEAVKELPKLANSLIESMNLDVEIELLTIEDHTLRNTLVNKEQELRDMKSSLKDIEKQAEDLKKIVEDRKRQGQRLLREAKEATGAAPGEPEFDTLQETFSTLPDTTDGIDIAIKDNEGRLEFCGPDVNANIIEDYESQKAMVEKLKANIATTTEEEEKLKSDMERVRVCWVPEVKNLANNISERYGRLFEYMNCVGEVHLVEGDPLKGGTDFENYGLQIKVKFRSEEPLRDLCGAQSGGERSVATAIYLLALQELTNVPFRCMDEINQGMDPTNERRIMNLMMKMSELDDSCQYFVVTPKLLPQLKYARSVTVMCVCQPSRFDSTRWKMAYFFKAILDERKSETSSPASKRKKVK